MYSPAFLDVSADASFVPDIRALVDSGVTRGCDDLGRFFCPDDVVTRGQMAAFLVRALDLASTDSSSFPGDDTVFAADVTALARAGIARGCNPPENTTFCPEESVTRAQMAAFLVRGVPLGDVAVLPDGVLLTRLEHPTASVGTVVRVCPNGTALEVRNAAWGSVFPAVGADHPADRCFGHSR